MDEPLWDMEGYRGTISRTNIYGHNYDDERYILLLEACYDQMLTVQPQLRRKMPYCAFQHTMCEVLISYQFRMIARNRDTRLETEAMPDNIIRDEDLVIPEPITIYLEAIANTSTAKGDTVRYNLPEAGLSQLAIPGAAPVPAIPAGSFGAVTKTTHNAYEAYIAPLVTSGLVTAAYEYNVLHPQPQQPWQPLPDGSFPQGAEPNENLLGWKMPERLHSEALKIPSPITVASKPVSKINSDILFIDGHTSHLTLHTSRFCEQNGIVLVALLPNPTHLIQPLDVSVSRSVKQHWKDKVHHWRLKNMDAPILKKKDFAELLKEVLDQKYSANILTNGFRKCGLVPWNPKIPIDGIENRELCRAAACTDITRDDAKTGLKVLEKIIGEQKLMTFTTTHSGPNIEDKGRMQQAAVVYRLVAILDGVGRREGGLERLNCSVRTRSLCFKSFRKRVIRCHACSRMQYHRKNYRFDLSTCRNHLRGKEHGSQEPPEF